MRIETIGNNHIVTLSHKNLWELLEGGMADADTAPSITRHTKDGLLIVQVERDESHYAGRDDDAGPQIGDASALG